MPNYAPCNMSMPAPRGYFGRACVFFPNRNTTATTRGFFGNHTTSPVSPINLLKRRRKTLQGTYIWPVDRYSNNYYHWICEVLPKILYSMRIQDIHAVALPVAYSGSSFVEETLGLFDLQAVYFDPTWEYVRFENMYLPTAMAPEGHVHPGALLQTRDHIFKKLGLAVEKPAGRKVFISRKKAGKRRDRK